MRLSQFLRAGRSPVALPGWVADLIETVEEACACGGYVSDHDRMRLAIELSAENVRRGTGGPFGSVIVDLDTGDILGAGVNLVVPSCDPTAHGEVSAIRVGAALVDSFSFSAAGLRAGIYTSAEPCGMCCTASLWSGVRRVVYAATTEDVEAIGFDEGLKPGDWQAAMQRRGIEVAGPLLRKEAVAVLSSYRDSGQVIYNG